MKPRTELTTQDDGATPGRKRLSWAQVGHLTTETLMLSTMFIIVALPAVGLAALVKLAESAGTPQLLIYVFKFMEYSILVADALVFTFCLVRNAWQLITEIVT